MIDWALVENEVVALFIVWSPVEAVVVLLILALYRKVQKLAALQEMAPDLTADERAEIRAYGEEQVREIIKKRAAERAGRVYFLEGQP